MTVDYRANDPATGRTVVLTVPSEEVPDNPLVLARFYREARAAGALQHPNIIAIYDLGVDRGAPFITSELLEGSTLEQILEVEKQKGGLGPQESPIVLSYVLQASKGLAYAHQSGILHRDIRPGTIFVTKTGIAKLTNFALARLPHTSSLSTGALAGNMAYMSPEVMCGDRIDLSADIWAMGCTLYESLTFTKPFHGETLTQWMFAIMSQEPRRLMEMRPDLPADLEEVVHRAIKKDRNERYRKMEKMVAELEPIVLRLLTEAPPA